MARKSPAPPEQPPTPMYYVGAGAFVLGVPMRDLTAGEWAEFTDEQRQIAAPLYVPASPAEPDAPAEE